MRKPPAGPEQLARAWLHRSGAPGASLAIVQPGRAPLFKAYGFRDRAARLPATQRTVYGLASVTKSFTALAVLRLEEEGRLSTRDTVVRHLPEFGTPDPRATRRIRVHHLLSHTSGLPPLPSCVYTEARSLARDPSYDPEEDRRVGIDPDHPPIDTYEQLLEYLRTERYRLLGPPGQWFSYSNEAFGLLGAVIERASGRTYESYLEEEIFRPAGMRSTTFDTGILRRLPEVTTLYVPNAPGARPRLVPSQDWGEGSCLRACGGLRSNAEDMARFLQIFLGDGKVDGERIVTAASVRKMTTPHAEWFPGRQYGYGTILRPDYHGTTLAYHGGVSPGVSSLYVVCRERRVGGVVLANFRGLGADRALMPRINARLGLPVATPLEEVPKPTRSETSPRQYEGWYGSGEGMWFHVKGDRRALLLDSQGMLGHRRLRPAGNDRFVFPLNGENDQVQFKRDPQGRVWGVSCFARIVRRRERREFLRAPRLNVVW